MGRRSRERPERLPEKLFAIRNKLGLSQSEMLRRLNADEKMSYTRISEFETGKGEPSLITILQYARAARVPTEVLIDDELDLPEKLPASTNHDEIKRKFASRTKKR